MSIKFNQSSSDSTVQASTPKISIFGAKSGFVIPKNKLSGSLVPVFKGAKNESNSTNNRDGNKQIQRKTKWGPDPGPDPPVKKGRTLAYQTRLDQINKLINKKSDDLDKFIKEDLGSISPTKISNYADSDGKQMDKESRVLLDLERLEIIGELLNLNPNYKAPADYKPLLKEARVPIPTKEYPGFNFIQILLGTESSAQKRLQEETGAKIRVHGTKKETGEKREITQADLDEQQGAYEDLYIDVLAETYSKIDSAIALLETLLTPVTSVTPPTSAVPSATTTTPLSNTNQGLMQQFTPTAKHHLSQYPNYPSPWLPRASPGPPSSSHSFHYPAYNNNNNHNDQNNSSNSIPHRPPNPGFTPQKPSPFPASQPIQTGPGPHRPVQAPSSPVPPHMRPPVHVHMRGQPGPTLGAPHQHTPYLPVHTPGMGHPSVYPPQSNHSIRPVQPMPNDFTYQPLNSSYQMGLTRSRAPPPPYNQPPPPHHPVYPNPNPNPNAGMYMDPRGLLGQPVYPSAHQPPQNPPSWNRRGTGTGTVYDPFSPGTGSNSVPLGPRRQQGEGTAGKKLEMDSEYEDLMASMGVK